MKTVLYTIQFIVVITLLILVLMQQSKADGLKGFMTGSQETFFNKNKSKTREARLVKLTVIFTILFGMITGVPLWIQIVLPFFVVAIKLIVMNYSIYYFKKTNKASNENLPTKFVWGFVGVCLLLAYGLPAINIVLNKNIFLSNLFV